MEFLPILLVVLVSSTLHYQVPPLATLRRFAPLERNVSQTKNTSYMYVPSGAVLPDKSWDMHRVTTKRYESSETIQREY